ncbi:MAG: hypothetical protein MZV65_46375 [Chromatiales bacterium]|nr:hypothetical protein [Chromatiales bacterium]
MSVFVQAGGALGKNWIRLCKTKLRSENLSRLVDVELIGLASNTNLGTISWEQAAKDLPILKLTSENAWQDYSKFGAC